MDQIDPAEIPLRDIHLPDPISWWPLAPGWWLLLAAVLAIIVTMFFAWRFFAQRQYRRAEKALSTIEQNYQQHGDDHRLARELSILARQLALLENKEPPLAQHGIGKEWADYWQRKIGDDDVTADEIREALTVAPYRRESNLDGTKLIAGMRRAIKNTRRLHWLPGRSNQAA